MFKMAKKWGNAGEAFVKAGDLHLKGMSRHDAATNFVEAGNCYKKTDIKGTFSLGVTAFALRNLTLLLLLQRQWHVWNVLSNSTW
jgi:hypothetical protein